jgi:hypothetical protein
MKILKSNINSILLCCILAMLSACGTKDTATIKEINEAILKAHPWHLENLKVDGIDQTSLYNGMTLSFGATTFNANNGAPVWPATGTWLFIDSDVSGGTIKRDDDIEITINQIDDNKAILSLMWSKTTYSEGRTSSVTGNHIYTFKK